MNTELARIVLLLVMFVGYVAICAWAFAPRNRARFEAAGRLALDSAKPDFEPLHLVSEPLASAHPVSAKPVSANLASAKGEPRR